MKTLKNQTVYQCEFCNKRLLTKKGAQIHETQYCWHQNSPHQVKAEAFRFKQISNCSHINIEEVWRTIPGEAIKEPDYDQCIDCGARGSELRIGDEDRG